MHKPCFAVGVYLIFSFTSIGGLALASDNWKVNAFGHGAADGPLVSSPYEHCISLSSTPAHDITDGRTYTDVKFLGFLDNQGQPTADVERIRSAVCSFKHPWWISPWRAGYELVSTCGSVLPINPTTGKCADDLGKGEPEACPNSLSGNPINAANGNKLQIEIDMPGVSSSTLQFARTYNSVDGLWRHNHSTYLRLVGNSVALVMSDGRESFFIVNNATTPATITASSTELGLLVKDGGTWRYTAKNNDTYNFDATGRLTRWANAAGAEHLLAYANGTVTVRDKFGQSLSFTEDVQRQALTMSTSGLSIQYEYNTNKRLSKLTRTRGGQTEQRLFHYEIVEKPHLLTGITDERGVRYATWSYDDQGRATSSEHAGGIERTDIAYNNDGSSTITNEFGKKSTYRFVTIDGVKRVSAIEGEALGSCPMSNSTFTYDARGLLKTKTDNKGHLTTYDYNTRGLEVSRTEAAGTAQARTITTDWHPTLSLPVVVTEPARITTYTYDAQGRQLGQSVTQR